MTSTDTAVRNWGKCEGQGCKLVWGPRCNSGLCIKCCDVQHTYWLGHRMADGSTNSVTAKAEQRIGKPVSEVGDPNAYSPLPLHYGGQTNVSSEPPKPKVPEPGKMEELTDETVLLPTPDNSYGGTKGGKSGFPVSYIK